MFRDTREELERLEAELLAEEQEDELDELLEEFLEEDDAGFIEDLPPVYRNYSNNYGRDFRAYNTDQTDEDLDDYSEAVLEPQKGVAGLMVLALLLLLGIVGVLAWWAIRFF